MLERQGKTSSRRVPSVVQIPLRNILVAIQLVAALATMTIPALAATHIAPLPPGVTILAPGLHRLGTARHTVFGFHVFDATLWVAGPQWSPSEAHALDIEASRGIPPSRLVNSVIDEMRDMKVANDRQRSMWKQSLERILPTLSRGDQLVILCLPDRQTVIFHNSSKVGTVDDPNFGSALFRVWLDPLASRQDIRSALLQN
jgi:Chalcone isomerase-like